VKRHTLKHRQHPAKVLLTELTRLQRKLLKLIGLPAKDYAADLPPPGNSEKMKPRCAESG
jgi:hypothetical protein